MKPSLILISPIAPSFSVNGLTMRAAHNLRALSEKYSVHLLIISSLPLEQEMPTDDILALCASWKIISTRYSFKRKVFLFFKNRMTWKRTKLPSEWSRWNLKTDRQIKTYLAQREYTHIWVFRFTLLPWIKDLINGSVKLWLDLDELESTTRERLAVLYSKRRDVAKSREFQKEAAAYRELEKKYLPHFELIITASDLESARIRNAYEKAWIETWPNIISQPARTVTGEPKEHSELKLLFIGNMTHFPNRDAIRYAMEEILPRVQRLVGQCQVILQVAGSNADIYRSDFTQMRGLVWLGTVKDLTPLYEETDVVIVPLRSGGGTRLKILEAFAHRKSVVSTNIGAEGLDILHDRELLLADEPDAMAAACADLLLHQEKRFRLGAAAYDYVMARHTEINLKRKVDELAGQHSNPSTQVLHQ